MADKDQKKKKLEGFLKKRHVQRVYGRPLQELFQETGQMIPNVVIDCISFLREFPDALKTEGIFRISPSIVQIAKVKEAYVSSSVSVNLFQLTSDVHVVASCLKHFFQDLAEPLFPFPFYEQLAKAYDGQSRKEDLQKLLDAIPPCNRYILATLFDFLQEVIALSDVNKMTFQNVAVCFGPNLIRPKVLTPQVMMDKYDSKITQWYLENYEEVVKIDGMEDVNKRKDLGRQGSQIKSGKSAGKTGKKDKNRASKSLKPPKDSKKDKKRSSQLVPPAKDKSKRSSEISGPTKVTRGGNLPPELLQAMGEAMMTPGSGAQTSPQPSSQSPLSQSFTAYPSGSMSDRSVMVSSASGDLPRGKPAGNRRSQLGASAFGNPAPPPPVPAALPDVVEAIALYDYTARAENELSLQKDETVRVLKKSNTQWWYSESTLSGKKGFAPTTYLREK